MLEHLHIRNLALIDDMSLDFGAGINALTGETGAGKSFILKALGFLLGDRLTPEMVRPGAERAQVDALFHLGGDELILRRELIAATGRSRFYINDTLSSQEALKELRSRLLSHASQHAQQSLMLPSYQAALFERRIKDQALLIKRDKLLNKLRLVSDEIASLQTRRGALQEKREFLEMQKNEIEKVNPKEGEEEELENLRAKAKANVSARQNYNKAIALLQGEDGPGLIQQLQDFGQLLRQMSVNDPDLGPDAEKVEEIRLQISHIASMIKKPRAAEKMDMNAIEERLFAFAQLKRKLKRSLTEILDLRQEIEQNLSFLDVCNLDLGRLEKERAALSAELGRIVGQIKPLRREAASEFSRELEEQLRDLGFSEHVRVVPDFSPQEIWPGIMEERGRINWAPNPGQTPLPLDKIASGGELSRFLLALTILGDQDKDLTFIFDEVDAGVGGLTLNKLADKLQSLSRRHQIILITHWPQLAARATNHFSIRKIVKDKSTYTLCQPLNEGEREAELARMAGGGPQGAAMAGNLLKKK